MTLSGRKALPIERKTIPNTIFAANFAFQCTIYMNLSQKKTFFLPSKLLCCDLLFVQKGKEKKYCFALVLCHVAR